MSILESIDKNIKIVDKRLKELLEYSVPATCLKESGILNGPQSLYEAVAYSVFAGGKRLRPLLMIGACEGMGASSDECIDFACALEMIHTYSLIHDDLPAMDNDDFRRGMPTNHKVYGEATAILAGDALLNKAFEVMSHQCLLKQEYSVLNAMNIIAKAAGMDGMIAGQAADMYSEDKTIGKEDLLYIHETKTAALITAALKAGCALGGGNEAQVVKIGEAGYSMGIAFQIKDDLLDVYGDPKKLGKPVKSDERNKKSTYVTVHGMEKAEEDYEKYSGNAVNILTSMGMKNDFLVSLARYVINRNK